LILILFARLYLAFQIFPVNSLHVDYYHGRKLWAEDIKAIAGDKPVVFETGNGALREAPLYSFYSGGLGIAFYPGDNKKSQYQIWNYEDSIQSKDVILIKNGQFDGSHELRTRMGKTINYKEVDNFTSLNNIRILYNVKDVLFRKDSIEIPIKIINHRQAPLHFTNNQRIYVLLRDGKNTEYEFEQTLNNYLSVNSLDTAKLNFSFNATDIGKGNYELTFGIIDGITDPSLNSKKGTLIVSR
jgi:hypothetical protein